MIIQPDTVFFYIGHPWIYVGGAARGARCERLTWGPTVNKSIGYSRTGDIRVLPVALEIGARA